MAECVNLTIQTGTASPFLPGQEACSSAAEAHRTVTSAASAQCSTPSLTCALLHDRRRSCISLESACSIAFELKLKVMKLVRKLPTRAGTWPGVAKRSRCGPPEAALPLRHIIDSGSFLPVFAARVRQTACELLASPPDSAALGVTCYRGRDGTHSCCRHVRPCSHRPSHELSLAIVPAPAPAPAGHTPVSVALCAFLATSQSHRVLSSRHRTVYTPLSPAPRSRKRQLWCQ